MAKTLFASPLITIKEDYIDMDLSPKLHAPSKKDPGGEFEFKTTSNDVAGMESNSTAYPADELFYKGNLLPLQIPPRIELVQKLFHEPNNHHHHHHHQDQSNCKEKHWPKRHWPKRLKFFKQTSHLGSKIKASKEYLKSLFTTKNNTSIVEEDDTDQFGAAKVFSITLKSTMINEEIGHRKSFSGVIRRRLMAGGGKSSQVSGFTMCSSELNRWLEEESSIQGAIAYCKKTQENLVPSRRSVSDLSFCSFERGDMSRG